MGARTMRFLNQLSTYINLSLGYYRYKFSRIVIDFSCICMPVGGALCASLLVRPHTGFLANVGERSYAAEDVAIV